MITQNRVIVKKTLDLMTDFVRQFWFQVVSRTPALYLMGTKCTYRLDEVTGWLIAF